MASERSSDSMSPAEAFAHAVAIIGSQSATARLLSVTQGSISKRIAEGKAVSAKYVLKIAAESGVPKEVLRPDLYPRDLDPPVGAAMEPVR